MFNYFAMTLADCKADQSSKLLGLIPKWYEYLSYTPDALHNCSISLSIMKDSTSAPSFAGFLLIGLAVLDMVIHLAGVIAVGFVVYGGLQYMTSQGEPDRVEKAKNTLMNALIGLVIVIVAIPVVAFIGNKLGG